MKFENIHYNEIRKEWEISYPCCKCKNLFTDELITN